MRAVGLITEYNPFHNGHLYHLQQSKELAGAEVAVVVMSGHFLQRGEAALCDKWRRTEMALAAGVDLVVELPYLFACNSAPHFARGAILSLEALGGVDSLCFGSEAGGLEPLQQTAELLEAKSEEITAQTQNLLRQGVGYPAARAEIMHRLLPGLPAEILTAPNNILGIEYLRALAQSGSTIRARTVQRRGAGYHDLEGRGAIASATGIRKMLKEETAVAEYLPSRVLDILDSARGNGEMPDADHHLRLLLARILRGAESLEGIYQIESGQENRLFEAAGDAKSLEELIDRIKARQLTRTRVQRVLCHLLHEVEAGLAQRLLEQGPLFLHLLGSSQAGEKFLAASRKQRSLPLISNYSRIHNQLQRFYGRGSKRLLLAQEQLHLELRSSDNYALLQRGFSARRQRDYFETVRRFESVRCETKE